MVRLVEDFDSLITSCKNAFENRADFLVGRTQVCGSPRGICVIITSACNLKCVMCHHANVPDWKSVDMDIEVIKKLESYLRRADFVEINGVGEPLGSLPFMNFLEILSSGDHGFNFVTNGTLLDEKKTQVLLASATSAGLLNVSISLDAATKETYYKIRGANFNRVVENIRNFVDERNRQTRKTPKVWINMTLSVTNLSEAEEFVKLGHDLGVDGVRFQKLNTTEDRLKWETTRGDWVFNYSEQCLENIPNNIVAQVINRVKVRAGELGIPVYFDELKDLGEIGIESLVRLKKKH
ncbi:MAG: radical SAM protein [Methanotrichaceae archaeon]|nr:radical SAM protein [Methanotrichaceae archaeon]